MNKVLVLGASGATGKHLVADLLSRGINVIALVRPTSSLKNRFDGHSNYTEVSGSISDMTEDELQAIFEGCDAAFSCLGHNLTFKGIFGEPKRLVTNAIEKIARVITALEPDKKVKIILMNSSGNSNRDIPEIPPLSQRIVIAILRAITPPHSDNEQAADFLRTEIGQNHPLIEWSAVRPGGLKNSEEITKYEVFASPDRNVIFNDGATSRINVANFMANLATDSELWNNWKGKMPVVYNKT